MDKYRKTVIEFVVMLDAIKQEPQFKKDAKTGLVTIRAEDWNMLELISDRAKQSFNHSLQFQMEQGLKRQLRRRGNNPDPGVNLEKNAEGV